MKLTEILSTLQQTIPPQALSSKTIKGQRIIYVSWYVLADLLDERAGLGNWEWQVKEVQQVGERLTLTGCLTIYGSDRALTMSATGSESINCSGYGDPSSNSEAMALRRAAAKFGLGRELWAKDKLSPIPHSKTTQTTPAGQITREEWLRRKAAAQG